METVFESSWSVLLLMNWSQAQQDDIVPVVISLLCESASFSCLNYIGFELTRIYMWVQQYLFILWIDNWETHFLYHFWDLQTEPFCALYVYIIIRYPTPMTVLYVTKIAVNYAIDVIVCQQMSAHYTSYFLLTTYGKLSWTDYFNSQFTIS